MRGLRRLSLVLVGIALAGGADAQRAGCPLPQGYIPEPKPVKSAVEVTAFYYPGTEHMPEWNMVEQVQPERKPLLGWYDESDPENIDWQIKWAVEHGISSFCVCWYWNRGVQRLDHWVKAFYKAKFRSYFKWYMMYANHNAPGAHSTADQIAVSKFWIDNYFKTPEYYKIDGKPVVVIWFCDSIDRDFIAEAKAKGEILKPGEGVKRAFAITEKMAKEAGLPGVHWIDMYHGNYDPKKVDYAKSIGCKAQMIYSFVWQALTIAKDCRKPTDTDLCFSYDLLDVAVQRWWEESTQDDSLPFWPMVPTGWDARSRYFQRSLNVIGRTPEKFGEICRKCRAFCEKKGLDHVVVMPINEWQEGSYIEPNAEYGFGMYDALRDAFCEKPAEGWPKNLTPQDVGRPLKEYPPMSFSPVQSWSFDNSTEGWYRQPYGSQKTYWRNGCLWFLTSFADNFQIRQRLVPFAASKYKSFKIRMKIALNADEGMGKDASAPQMRLTWGTTKRPIVDKNLTVNFDRAVASLPVIPDGDWHEYEMDLADLPDWRGDVNELWFEAINAKHAIVDIDWMRFSPDAVSSKLYTFIDPTPKKRFSCVAPDLRNVAYGADPMQKMHVWLPRRKGAGKAPVVVHIHGGGWSGGVIVDRILATSLDRLLDAGFGVVALSYRLLGQANGERPRVMASLNDCETAIRHVLSRADQWGFDRSRIGLVGGSAGAATLLYLGLKENNPYRIAALSAIMPQTSLDPQEMKEWIPNSTYGAYAFGYRSFDDWLAHRDESLPDINRISATSLLRAIDAKKAPRIFLQSKYRVVPGALPKDPTHAGEFCVNFKRLCDEKGVACELAYGDENHFRNAYDVLIDALTTKSPDELAAEFALPPDWAKPWTYWLWMNGHADEKTIVEDLADIKDLGFGGILLNDARGYWEDDEHIVTPAPEHEWMSPPQVAKYALAMRTAKKLGIEMSINTGPNGGKLCGPWKTGVDAPKRLTVKVEPMEKSSNRRIVESSNQSNARRIDESIEQSTNRRIDESKNSPIPICSLAVRTAEPLPPRDWYTGGDGTFTMKASSGKRTDGADYKPVAALEVVPYDESFVPSNGNWSVVRFAYEPMPGRDYDVDILDPNAVRRHFARFFAPLKAAFGDLIGPTLTYLYSVSWEGAVPNWSPNFAADYRRLTGEEIGACLPILAGFTLPNVDTETFMTKYRRARNDMFRENFYGTFAEIAHGEGLRWYSESGGPWSRRKEIFGEADQLEFLSVNDIPQGEFWETGELGIDPRMRHANTGGRWHIRGAVNAAHVYDKRIASVEAFTHMLRHWSVDPAVLKPVGDVGFADGANRYLWHTYTSSPERFGTPGIEYFAGTHINRNVTWHDEAKGFITYLARCQYLLQLGKPVTDIALLGGDRTYSHWGRYRVKPSDEAHLDVTIPDGFSYDLVCDDALAKNPRLLDRYAVVYDVRKKENLKKTVPVGNLLPDAVGPFTWTHRRLGDAEWYFVCGEGKGEMTFRATASSVEIWDAVTGRRRHAKAERTVDGRTRVKLDLPMGGSAFVMFLTAATISDCNGQDARCPSDSDGQDARCPGGAESTCQSLTAPWSVSFAYPKGVAAEPPKPVTMEKLVDFTTCETLKHFSGTATYRTTFEVDGGKLPHTLSLGDIPSGLAHVYLNGMDCGTAWCAPWSVDIASVVRAGRNELEIRYINNWVNRLTGDCELPAERRVTKSDLHYWRETRQPKRPNGKIWTDTFGMKPTPYSGPAAGDPLQPSGLLGPVTLAY